MGCNWICKCFMAHNLGVSLADHYLVSLTPAVELQFVYDAVQQQIMAQGYLSEHYLTRRRQT